MKIDINLNTIGNIASNIDHYYSLPGYFFQLKSGEEGKKLKQFWQENITKKDTCQISIPGYSKWKEISLHIVRQVWGNTSCGWEGVGGSAMTADYTMIIENNHYKLAFIYYQNSLAYVCKMDDAYKEYIKDGYRALPGHKGSRELLNLIYSN